MVGYYCKCWMSSGLTHDTIYRVRLIEAVREICQCVTKHGWSISKLKGQAPASKRSWSLLLQFGYTPSLYFAHKVLSNSST